MNKWVPFADLRNARPFAPAYKVGETDVFEATFSGHEKNFGRPLANLEEKNFHREMWAMKSGLLNACQ